MFIFLVVGFDNDSGFPPVLEFSTLYSCVVDCGPVYFSSSAVLFPISEEDTMVEEKIVGGDEEERVGS